MRGDLIADARDGLCPLGEGSNAPGSAVTVSGDLWQLGKNRVLCGNSLIPASYERLMKGAKADLVIADPPYNVVIDGNAAGIAPERLTIASSRWRRLTKISPSVYAAPTWSENS